jgi:hypothetical protein
MQRPTCSFFNPVLCCLALALTANPALAEDEAAGRVLFNDAMLLLKKGAFDEACPKFEESVKQSYNINAHYFLADCLERQGKTATAWTTFLTVATKAKAAGDSRREQAARSRAVGLEPKLVRLRIVVRSDVDGLEIRRNGSLVGKPMWGALLPVDPGEIEFTASAPDFEPYRATVNAVGEGRVIEVRIPRLVRNDAPTASSNASPAASPAPLSEPTPEKTPRRRVASPPPPSVGTRDAAPQSGGHSLSTIGWVVGGVGVLTMVGGGVVALAAKSSFNDAKTAFENCKPGDCEDQNLDKEKSAIRMANLATGLFIGGAAATAVGVVLVIAGASENESQPSLSVGIRPSGVALAGRF